MEDKKPKQTIVIPTPGSGLPPTIRGEKELAGGYVQPSEIETVISPEVGEFVKVNPQGPEISQDLKNVGVTHSQPDLRETKDTVNLQVTPQEAKAVDATHAEPWIAVLLERVRTKIRSFTNS